MNFDFTNEIRNIGHPIYKLKYVDWIDSNGFYTKRVEVDVMFSGSLQPITSDEESRFAPGWLKTGSSKLFASNTDVSLDVGDRVKDVINRVWVIKSIEDWSLDGNYSKYILERVLDG